MLFSNLKIMGDPPTDINLLGRILPQDEKNIIIIGSRRMTKYGKMVLKYIVPPLVKEGFTIISGLAIGCDSYAFKIALEKGGRVIGVLGFGLDYINGDKNSEFINSLLSSKNVVIFSPFKRSKPPSRDTFLYRNKVMAYIGSSVLVVEAGNRSGTFHTVNTALDIGKNVMAIPGNIFSSQCQGTNRLIKEGAYLVSNYKDVLSILKSNF